VLGGIYNSTISFTTERVAGIVTYSSESGVNMYRRTRVLAQLSEVQPLEHRIQCCVSLHYDYNVVGIRLFTQIANNFFRSRLKSGPMHDSF
jgi:hypothetical protein